MKFSDFDVARNALGSEFLLMLDPHEISPEKRLKRVSTSSIAGKPGKEGSPGKSTYEIWRQNGNQGSQEEFLAKQKGDPGKSAYQSWLDSGNQGTEPEFVEDLKGEKGDSNYKVWLDAGNEGTEEDFFDSLKGQDGEDGTTFYNGDGPPPPELGAIGDYYIDRNTGGLYARSENGWGEPFLFMEGTRGTVWHKGDGAPSPDIGGLNDFYVDQSTSDVYGPKTEDGWGTSTFNIKGGTGNRGSQGPQGSLFLRSSAPPENSSGRNGDYHINESNGDFFGPKTNNFWGNTPFMSLLNKNTTIPVRDGADNIKYNVTFTEGLKIDRSGVITLSFNEENKVFVIGANVTWASVSDKPNSLAGFGITDAYTKTDTNQAIRDALTWNNISNKPTTRNGYGLTDVYTKTETDQAINNAVSNGRHSSTDSLTEGDTNKYYTNERAVAAVANVLANSSTINLEYDAENNVILATLKEQTTKQSIQIFRVYDNSTVVGSGSGVDSLFAQANLTNVKMSVSLKNPQSIGPEVTVDIKVNNASVLANPMVIPNGTRTSPKVAATDIVEGSELFVDIPSVGDGSAVGLTLYITHS